MDYLLAIATLIGLTLIALIGGSYLCIGVMYLVNSIDNKRKQHQ